MTPGTIHPAYLPFLTPEFIAAQTTLDISNYDFFTTHEHPLACSPFDDSQLPVQTGFQRAAETFGMQFGLKPKAISLLTRKLPIDTLERQITRLIPAATGAAIFGAGIFSFHSHDMIVSGFAVLLAGLIHAAGAPTEERYKEHFHPQGNAEAKAKWFVSYLHETNFIDPLTKKPLLNILLSLVDLINIVDVHETDYRKGYFQKEAIATIKKFMEAALDQTRVSHNDVKEKGGLSKLSWQRNNQSPLALYLEGLLWLGYEPKQIAQLFRTYFYPDMPVGGRYRIAVSGHDGVDMEIGDRGLTLLATAEQIRNPAKHPHPLPVQYDEAKRNELADLLCKIARNHLPRNDFKISAAPLKDAPKTPAPLPQTGELPNGFKKAWIPNMTNDGQGRLYIPQTFDEAGRLFATKIAERISKQWHQVTDEDRLQAGIEITTNNNNTIITAKSPFVYLPDGRKVDRNTLGLDYFEQPLELRSLGLFPQTFYSYDVEYRFDDKGNLIHAKVILRTSIKGQFFKPNNPLLVTDKEVTAHEVLIYQAPNTPEAPDSTVSLLKKQIKTGLDVILQDKLASDELIESIKANREYYEDYLLAEFLRKREEKTEDGWPKEWPENILNWAIDDFNYPRETFSFDDEEPNEAEVWFIASRDIFEKNPTVTTAPFWVPSFSVLINWLERAQAKLPPQD